MRSKGPLVQYKKSALNIVLRINILFILEVSLEILFVTGIKYGRLRGQIIDRTRKNGLRKLHCCQSEVNRDLGINISLTEKTASYMLQKKNKGTKELIEPNL